ncbi:hypothetical protein KGA66_19855 [Actinocrinis puniceicyclus]|uniref:Uncharacterized protein n=1 Tax=Actinocrinis puniceicyclus TaxID=977794 RepID=A0A8J7WRG9_9ACTN|nr:hypothetical protein [Actinocrinis puniceicyclus]MBS2965315.1 hypothetical protein [Actinocrinis puniceicyclus]
MNVPPLPVSPRGRLPIGIADPVVSWTPEQAATGSFQPAPVHFAASYPQVAASDLTGLLVAR